MQIARRHPSDGAHFEPLREGTFRAIWPTSVLSNFGQLIQGVGAAWEMTRLTTSPSMVALVQTALMLPLMLVQCRPAQSPTCSTSARSRWSDSPSPRSAPRR